ncbi:MAG: chemotaxis response regulator protein-glutamate methylesterase [Alphaproteobacteria bacterium]|nr:chemotaxis response regulator protein-glutamate methylesterase [Alphaproteobacteria bacterium]
MKPVRVLVVDDSATIRRLLSEILSRDSGIEVLGAAADAAQARRMIRELVPDVITLDVEMPNMNGLEFLEKIMRLRPMPVVMVSTLTQKGAEVTLSALEIGAVDYFAKPTDNVATHLDASARELCEKVVVAARARVKPYTRRDPPAVPAEADFDPGKWVVAIGSSTGGVEALIEVLSHFPENCPPTVITQHMPSHFTASFAERLDRLSRPKVSEARDGDVLAPGRVFLAPGGETHLEVIGGRSALRCSVRQGAPVGGHRPSVDVLFQSMASAVKSDGIGVILTGMGRDGAAGLLEMRTRGAATVGQDETSCVVYGMPRAAQEIGAVEQQLPLDRIGPEIINVCKNRARKAMSHALCS